MCDQSRESVRRSHQASTIGNAVSSSCWSFQNSTPFDARVLPPRAVGLLDPPEVSSSRIAPARVAGRLLSRRGVVEVARPDQVVRARELLLVERQRAPDPGHARRGDRGAAEALVLGCGEHQQRLLVEAAHVPVARHGRGRALERGEVTAPAGLEASRPRRRTRARASAVRRHGRRAGVDAEADRERQSGCLRLPSSRVCAPWTTLPGSFASQPLDRSSACRSRHGSLSLPL